MSGFFTLHRDLPREGPGGAADVIWALAQLPVPGRVADLACGPGVDLVTLAQALPKSVLPGIARQAHFVAAAQAQVAGFGARVTVEQGDMAKPGGSHDLIWWAGAIYFPGIAAALGLWRAAPAPGGHVAFSLPVLLQSPPGRIVEAFWQDEGEIATEAAIRAAVSGAEWREMATRVIVGAPWAAHYGPMAARNAALLPGADADLGSVLADGAGEVFLWQQEPGEIACLLAVVAPE